MREQHYMTRTIALVMLFFALLTPVVFHLGINCFAQASREEILRCWLILLGGGLFTALLTTVVVMRRLVNPLISLGSQVRAIMAASSHDERVTIDPRSDVADIAAAFNNHMDLLARKEQQLADRNRLLSSILDTASTGISAFDHDGRFRLVNRAYCQLSGYDEDELIGHSMTLVLPPESHDEALRLYREFHAGKLASIPPLWEGMCKDGSRKSVTIQTSRLALEDGEIIVIAVVQDITERIMSEAALRKSEEKFAAAFRNAPTLIAITRVRDGMIFDVNESFLRAFGYEKHELVGHTTHDVGFWPGSADRAAIMKEIREQGRVREREIATRNKNGDEMWVLFSCESIEIDNERCIITTLSNITARKLVEMDLRRSEERFRSLVELAVDAILQGDPAGNIIGANESALLLTGYDQHELLGMNIRCLFAEEELERVPLRYDLLKEGKVVRHVRRLTCKNGATVPVEMNTRMMPDGSYQAFFRDMSERLAAEEALLQSESHMRAILRQAPIAMMIFSSDGVIEYLNDRFVATFGYSPADIPTLDTWWPLAYPDPEYRREVRARVREKVERARREGTDFAPQQVCITCKDGTERSVEVFGTPIGERNLIIMNDITAHKEVEAELRKAKEAADSVNRAKSEFFANISHEIRTPLTAIIGFADLIQTTDDKVIQKRYLDMIITSGEILQYLIKDLLDLTKIESGKLELEIAPFVLAEMIARSCAAQEVIARQKGLKFTTFIDPATPPFLRGDAEHLRQILANLVSNAVKFTHKGEVTLAVNRDDAALPPGGDAEASSSPGSRLHFAVHDTGIGISEEKQALIFESFTQADGSTSRKYGGFGLGTTIAKRLVDLMGGRIWLESSPGDGSTFHVSIELPVVNEEELRTLCDRQTAGTGPAGFAPHDGLLRILVAEDSEFSQHLFADALRGLGHDAAVADNGKAAVELFREENYDMILMDVQMPEMSGLEATREIRLIEQSRGGHIPIIAMTASGRAEDRERCLAAGMDQFLTKPVTLSALVHCIHAAVRPSSATTSPESGKEPAGADCQDLLRSEMLPSALRNLGADLRRYAQLLCNDLERTLGRIEEAINDENRPELARAAHTLKGIAAPLRKGTIGRLAIELEESVSAITLERAHKLLRLLREEYVAIAAIGSAPGGEPSSLLTT